MILPGHPTNGCSSSDASKPMLHLNRDILDCLRLSPHIILTILGHSGN